MVARSLIAINFHGIGEPARKLERGETPYWISETQYCAVLDQIVVSPYRDRVRITFDDSNLSDLTIGLPALVARGLTARFFVLTGRIGQPGSLRQQDILAIQMAGMTIGSHGVNHVVWSRADSSVLQDETIGSRSALQDVTGTPIDEAAIPFGAWNGRVLRALRKAGYSTVWSSDGGTCRDGAFLRPRSSVRGDMGEEDVARLLSGVMPAGKHLRRSAGQIRKRMSGLLG